MESKLLQDDDNFLEPKIEEIISEKNETQSSPITTKLELNQQQITPQKQPSSLVDYIEKETPSNNGKINLNSLSNAEFEVLFVEQ